MWNYFEFAGKQFRRCLFCFKLRQRSGTVLAILIETLITVSIHCAPEMSEIDCIGRIESFWHKFVRGW